jgi:hypothetical protein
MDGLFCFNMVLFDGADSFLFARIVQAKSGMAFPAKHNTAFQPQC